MTNQLIRITSNWYCAGAIVRDGRIIRSAPVLGRFVGQSAQRLLDYAKFRRFKVEQWSFNDDNGFQKVALRRKRERNLKKLKTESES